MLTACATAQSKMLKLDILPTERRLKVSHTLKNRMQRQLVCPCEPSNVHVLTTEPDFRASKEAEASLYLEKKQAEAITVKAEANFFAMKKEAEAMTEMAGAYGHMADVLGGPQGFVLAIKTRLRTQTDVQQAPPIFDAQRQHF